ncbi:uncharacterized protein LOC134278322 [Saccostrea cucullata]|uniref:uncharacterized protein LOC134278322 n=1 Tax=Saccostrea cuccullata TaxID=36930 RepID=UPI002ED20D08
MTNGGYVPFFNRRTTDMIFCMFWILFTFLGPVKGETACQMAMTQYSLPGASLCYSTSGTGNRVVLNAFDAHHSSVSVCKCTVTTTHSTKVNFAPLNQLQPTSQFCSSSIVVRTSTESGISMNCFIGGGLSITPQETMSFSFEKPPYSYDANYCIMLSPDNADATLSLNCEGDIPGMSSSTSTTQSTTTTTLPRTTTTTTTQSTTSTTTARPTTTTLATTTTTLAPTTTTATTSSTSTTKPTSTTTKPTSTTTKPTSTSTVTTTSSTTTSPQVSTQSTTTQKQTTAEKTTQSTTKRTSGLTTTKEANTGESVASTSEWSYIIPVIGAGVIVVVAIILAICYSQRKKRNNTYTHGNDSYAFKNKANSPYSPDYYAGPGMTSKISTSTKSTEINTIVIDDVRDNVSVSTNLSEGTYIRHNVRQPINNDAPMYAMVDKSAKENIPVTDVLYSQVDKSANQINQPLSSDAVYSQVDKSANQNLQTTEADVVY